jgi:hypothetical protein
MPINMPIATSGLREPKCAGRVPRGVKTACLMMIEQGVDFIGAAKANGLKPDTMRRWLHRPEVISFIRRERARYRASICASNEHVLAQIRDEGANAMARVRAVQVLEGVEGSQVAKSASEVPNMTIRIINQTVPSVSPPTIDVTSSKPSPSAEPSEPIFRVP